MDNIIIKTENLNLWFAENHVLKNINLNIFEKEITAIIGPSGCGKSTFIRSINRMNDFISICRIEGKIFFHDKNIYENTINPIFLRKEIGMVFQKPNPFPKSIRDNLVFGPRLYGEKNKKKLSAIAEEMLKKVNLWEEVKNDLNKNALALSGGQQQRLCLARALAVKPKIILMDEPCSALDPISTARIEELMLELKKEVTIIIVTHNMQQAARISKYTGFFLLGELIEFSKTKKLFTNPAHKRTEDYITGRFG